MSGSSGTKLDQLEDVTVRILEVPRAAPGNVLGGAERSSAVALEQGAHLIQGLDADGDHRAAAVVAAPLQGGRVEHAVERKVHSGAELQLHPAGRRGSLGQPHDVAPEPAGLLDV